MKVPHLYFLFKWRKTQLTWGNDFHLFISQFSKKLSSSSQFRNLVKDWNGRDASLFGSKAIKFFIACKITRNVFAEIAAAVADALGTDGAGLIIIIYYY